MTVTYEMNINGHVCRTVFYWETLGPVADFFLTYKTHLNIVSKQTPKSQEHPFVRHVSCSSIRFGSVAFLGRVDSTSSSRLYFGSVFVV